MDYRRSSEQLNQIKMKNAIFVFTLLLASTFSAQAQEKYMTRDAYVRFYSSTPMEDIEGINDQASSVYVPSSGQVVFQVPIKAFSFEKALMEEHFNENYMESDKIPNATFKGSIIDLDFQTLNETAIEVRLKGSLTIHGISQEVEEVFQMSLVKGQIRLEGTFMVAPEDYKINIPSAVADKIADSIEVTLKAAYTDK